MKGSLINSFDLFKAAMGNPEYLSEINKDILNQNLFLTNLEEGQLTVSNILETIPLIKNLKVKSLLIIYLLSQPEFFAQLKGNSIITRLTHPEQHLPSRLNALVHQLDASTLTTQTISKLNPEAALTILCSIPHFHQLNKAQIEALIEQHPPYERNKILHYWVKHLAFMPNAHYILAHLIQIGSDNVFDEINKLDPSKKEILVTNIIEHLGLFNNLSIKFLEHANKESHLLLAIRLYLNGHYNKAYTNFINLLTKRLLDKDHSFSLEAIELLFFLNEKIAFKELSNKTARFTNRYLRTQAETGSIALFYQNGVINTQRMLQTIILNPSSTGTLNESKPTEENPLIKSLTKQDKSINCFEYFLIHFKGRTHHINQLLNDYMDFYEHNENSRTRSQAIHHIAFMLKCPELEDVVREAIFTVFLNHPACFDEQVSIQLFLFDAKRTIRSFGFAGGTENYQRVINLCTSALKNIHTKNNQDIIQVAQKALTEAHQELNLAQNQGFLSGFIKWIKRCWFYGWSGFFKPNHPEYIVSSSLRNLTENPQNYLCKNDQKDIHIREINILDFSNENETPLTQETFEDLIKALSLYSLQNAPSDELATRKKIHTLYHEVMIHRSEHEGLYRWLKENQQPFIINQFRLLELGLKETPRTETDLLLTQLNEDSDHFHEVADEFYCPLPELIIPPSLPPLKNAETPDMMSSTTKVLSGCVNDAATYAQGAWQWAGGFFSTRKFAEEDDEYFEIEHVAPKPQEPIIFNNPK